MGFQYDGAGEADENIVKNLKISNNAEDIEMLPGDEGIFIKGDRIDDVETGWLKFNKIVLKVEGTSDDPEAYFYTCKENKLVELGSIPSEVKVLDFDGKGSVEGILRLSVLQTWWAPAKWGFVNDGTIAQKNQALYYPKQIGNEPVMLLEELPVYKEIGDNETTTIKPQEVNITKTDNKNYCYIEAKDGTSGWFKIENFYKVVDLDSKPATDVFTNLVMAD